LRFLSFAGKKSVLDHFGAFRCFSRYVGKMEAAQAVAEAGRLTFVPAASATRSHSCCLRVHATDAVSVRPTRSARGGGSGTSGSGRYEPSRLTGGDQEIALFFASACSAFPRDCTVLGTDSQPQVIAPRSRHCLSHKNSSNGSNSKNSKNDKGEEQEREQLLQEEEHRRHTLGTH
jgi:hypothetical protein